MNDLIVNLLFWFSFHWLSLATEPWSSPFPLKTTGVVPAVLAFFLTQNFGCGDRVKFILIQKKESFVEKLLTALTSQIV